MQVHSVRFTTGRVQSRNKDFTQNESFINEKVSFQGRKTTIAGAAAAGILAGYYFTMAAVVPPAVRQGTELVFVKNMETKAVSIAVEEGSSAEKQKFLSQVLNLAHQDPSSQSTQKCVELLDEYNFIEKADVPVVEKSIKEVLESGKTSEKAAKFYRDFLLKLKR